MMFKAQARQGRFICAGPIFFEARDIKDAVAQAESRLGGKSVNWRGKRIDVFAARHSSDADRCWCADCEAARAVDDDE